MDSREKLAKQVVHQAVNDFIDYHARDRPEMREVAHSAKHFLFGKDAMWVTSRRTWLECAGYDPQWFEERLANAYPKHTMSPRGRGKPANPASFISIRCPTCRRDFSVYKSMNKINPRRYCSRKCQGR